MLKGSLEEALQWREGKIRLKLNTSLPLPVNGEEDGAVAALESLQQLIEDARVEQPVGEAGAVELLRRLLHGRAELISARLAGQGHLLTGLKGRHVRLAVRFGLLLDALRLGLGFRLLLLLITGRIRTLR